LFIDTSKDKDYKLEFTCPDNVSMDTGTSKNIEVVIKNNGSGKLTNVGLDIKDDDIPQSLTVETPNKIDELAPGETHRFVLKVYAKADARRKLINYTSGRRVTRSRLNRRSST